MDPELAAKFQTVKTLLAEAATTMPAPIADKVNIFLSNEIVDYQQAKVEIEEILVMPEISECTSDHIHAIRQVRKGVVVVMVNLPAPTEPS
jgi:hypothetical protein